MSILESHDKVIRITHDDDVSAGVPLPAAMSPSIQGVMLVDIRLQRKRMTKASSMGVAA